MKRLLHAVIRIGDGEETPTLPSGLSCLVWDQLAVAFSIEEISSVAPSVPRLKEFARAIAELHEHHATVPFRFGCTFETDSQLVALLRDHRSAWAAALDRVAGCDEYSVHLVAESEQASTREPSQPVPELDSAGSPADKPGTRYLLARRVTMQQALMRQQQATARGDGVRLAVEGLYRGYHVKPAVPGHESAITLVFLVPRASEPAFREALKRVPAGAGQRLIVTGPWPAYHFAAAVEEAEPVAPVECPRR